MGIILLVDVKMFPGSSMNALNALPVLTCAVGFLLALSSILSVDRRKRVKMLAGIHFCLFQLNPILGPLKHFGISVGLAFRVQLDIEHRSLEGAGLSAELPFSSLTLFQCFSTRMTFGSKLLAWYTSKSLVL